MSGGSTHNIQGMRTAIVHIGSEKTGSTSIQDFMDRNSGLLKQNHCGFFRSAGFISNFKLVNYCQNTPSVFAGNMPRLSNDDADILKWKNQFYKEHTREIEQFQKSIDGDSTVLYSSEHFQSRVTDANDIRNLKTFLNTFFDKIRIVVYLRRQDLLAMSAHNTSIQGGATQRFDINRVSTTGLYYDYNKLLDRWAAVFGKSTISVRVFEKARMHNGNVVEDFCQIAGLTLPDSNDYVKVNSNERLSVTAQETLLRFNHLDDQNALLGGFKKQFLRQHLIAHLHKRKDNYPSILPARADVETFYAHYKERNDQLAEQWLDGQGFDESFDTYPASAVEHPEINAQQELEIALSELIPELLSKRKWRKALANS
jgi:hypothetical protein